MPLDLSYQFRDKNMKNFNMVTVKLKLSPKYKVLLSQEVMGGNVVEGKVPWSET